MRSGTIPLLTLATWLCATAAVRADSRLLVLSTVGPTPVPLLDASILESARADSRFHVFDRPVRVDTARRDARCATLDDACLLQIAIRRGVDRILYGVRATSPSDPERTELTLRVFDRFTGRTRESLVGTIETEALDDERDLADLTAKLVPFVLRVPEEGTAVVRADAGAIVELDGRAMGTVPPNGELELTPLRVGRRVLRVERPNRPAWEAPIVIRARDTIRVTVGTGSTVLGVDGPSPARPRATDGSIEPPPEWILTIPGDPPPPESADIFTFDLGLSRIRFSIPVIEEHVQRGEIRTTTNARVGFLPNVSSSGARVTAKLHF